MREALDTYAGAGAAPGVRHRIEHIETLQPDDLPRFAAQGVVASMQTQHMMWLSPDRRDNWSRRLGDDRCDRAFLTRALLESGATIALGSDWPVARFDPREGIAVGAAAPAAGHPDRAAYDDQAIDGLAALHGYTTGAALTGGDGDRRGRLRPGMDGPTSPCWPTTRSTAIPTSSSRYRCSRRLSTARSCSGARVWRRPRVVHRALPGPLAEPPGHWRARYCCRRDDPAMAHDPADR